MNQYFVYIMTNQPMLNSLFPAQSFKSHWVFQIVCLLFLAGLLFSGCGGGGPPQRVERGLVERLALRRKPIMNSPQYPNAETFHWFGWSVPGPVSGMVYRIRPEVGLSGMGRSYTVTIKSKSSELVADKPYKKGLYKKEVKSRGLDPDYLVVGQSRDRVASESYMVRRNDQNGLNAFLLGTGIKKLIWPSKESEGDPYVLASGLDAAGWNLRRGQVALSGNRLVVGTWASFVVSAGAASEDFSRPRVSLFELT